MKLHQRTDAGLVYRLTSRECDALQRLLSLYPMVPAGYSQLSRFADPDELGADEELLKTSLAEAKEEGRKAIQQLFTQGEHLEPITRGWLLKLSRSEVEWMLQVCGDIRVGCWLKLGSPDPQQERRLGVRLENLDLYIPMQMMSALQLMFIHSLRDPADADEGALETRVFDRSQVVPWNLGKAIEFPPVGEALIEFASPGLMAVGGDLSVDRLRAAYEGGLFPWSVDPVTWWCPSKRGIIELDSFHIPKSLERLLRKQPFEVTANKAFRQVMEGCAETRKAKTWISPQMIKAYEAFHQAGHAHSIECWQDGVLAGGIYGVAIGGLFAAESMFYRVTGASKVALVHLVETLRKNGFTLLDIQMVTKGTASFGAVEIPRHEYLRRLKPAVAQPVQFVF